MAIKIYYLSVTLTFPFSVVKFYRSNLPLFYVTGDRVKLCYENSLVSIEHVSSGSNNKLDCPIFVPREFFYPYYPECNINHLKKMFYQFS